MNYVEYFKNSMIETFSTFFMEEIAFTDQTSGGGMILSMGVAAVVGITGNRKGRVLVDMEMHTAEKLAKVLALDLEDENIPLFTAAELCNIVAGGATTNMNNMNCELGLRLTPPSIFSGIRPKIYSPNLQTHAMSFSTSYGMIFLNVGMEGE
jgi:CheY-specific phosphatase CheX